MLELWGVARVVAHERVISIGQIEVRHLNCANKWLMLNFNVLLFGLVWFLCVMTYQPSWII